MRSSEVASLYPKKKKDNQSFVLKNKLFRVFKEE